MPETRRPSSQPTTEDAAAGGWAYRPQMCPARERRMRLGHNLVHRLERGEEGGGRTRLVKKFNRSAAGQRMNDPRDVRPPQLAVGTAKYLLNEFVVNGDFDQSRYDFVFDRLRAVRQDIVLAKCDDFNAASVLSLCIRFHLYSSLALCETPSFDSHTNYLHLLECLKSLLVLLQNDAEARAELEEMAAVYLLVTLGSQEALRWVLGRPPAFRRLPLMRQGMDCALCYLNSNYVRLFRVARKLPPLLLLAFHVKSNIVIRHALTIMASGFSSANLSYPIRHLASLFSLTENPADEENYLSGCCRTLNLVVVDETQVIFSKNRINASNQISFVQNKHLKGRIDSLLSELLLRECM